MKRRIFIPTLLLFTVVSVGFLFIEPILAQSAPKLITPTLQVDIPTIQFSTATLEDGVLNINYLGDYIAGIYKYLLGISTTIAIVMLMIGGLQWAFGGVNEDSIKKAKERIKNAITGLVLLLSAYAILLIVNPNLIKLQFPELEVVQFVELSTEDTGSDVDALSLSTPPSTGTNGVPYYSQRNYTEVYGTTCDGSPTIKSSGCGPTSLAMVLSFYGVSATPISVAQAFERDGYRICGSGTAYQAFVSSKAVTEAGMVGEILSYADHTTIIEKLTNNEPIIISVGKSRFTSSGHFIVLTGINTDGTFSINDPNSGIQSAEQDEIWGIIKFAVYVHKK